MLIKSLLKVKRIITKIFYWNFSAYNEVFIKEPVNNLLCPGIYDYFEIIRFEIQTMSKKF